jgi:hypothetical protein
MSTNLKVFKLVSGDEIIGDLLEGSEDNIIKINKPMIFRTSTVIDPKGYPYDVTILKDWLVRTDTKIAEIPKAQVSLMFNPNEQTTKLYDLEIKRLEENPSEELLKGHDIMGDLPIKDEINDLMDEFMDAMTDIANEKIEEQYQPQKKKKRKKQPKTEEIDLSAIIPDELKKRPMIYLSMVIPPEAIMNLVTAGILDPEQLLSMIDEVKKANKFTGDEKKRKDFGNKFSDWNPDPESPDY